jgi:hypothetical protein
MRLIPASTLLLAAPLLAQQFPEIEPNGTPATAQVIAPGTQCNAGLVAAEEDWFTFTTPGGYHLITTAGGESASTDTTMALYDAAGTTPLAYNDDAVSLVSALNLELPAGTYTLRIKGFSTSTAGNYTLDVSQPIAKPYTGNEVEPNDTIATANAVADGTQLLSSLTPPLLAVSSDTVAAPVIVASNSVTSSTTTVITTAGLVAGAWNGVGYFVRFTSGVHTGVSRRITANTATTITTESWPSAPAATDTFDVVTSSVTVLTDVAAAGSTTTVLNATAALVASAFTTPSTSSHAVRFLTGANAGLSRTITANTATTITTAAWLAAPAAGDSFIVVSGGATQQVATTTALVPGQYSNQRSWLRCTSGVNTGQTRCILNNAANLISLVSAFSNAPAPGDSFVVDQYDSDTYRIDVTAPKAEVVFSVTEGTAPWVSGWSYEVLDSAGVRINATFFGTALADSPTAAPENRVSSFRVWPTGTYYVRIFQRRTALTGDDNLVPYGNYRFEAKIKDMNVLGTVAETEPVGGPQSNNTIATAIAISPGQMGVGNITNSAGADPSDLWGPINIPAQTLITFQVSQGATATPLADASILLRQVLDPVAGTLSAGTSVTTGNILETGNLNPRGAFNFLLPGTTYYLEVLSPGTGAAQAGDYVLEISLPDVPTYVAGNWAQVASNATGCGTTGVPTISRVMGGASNTFGEQPVVGQTFVTRTTNLNGVGNLGLMLLGTSGALGPSGAPAGSLPSVYNPQPLDISFLGATGCVINVNPLVIDVLFGDPSGTVDYVLPCPGNLALAGFTLFMQPCKWDFATPINALGIQPGNWARVIFGTRTF